ncbi:histone-lysine N-methyltransferase PRDM9-like isoform X1 [Silurus meridionalis]|uniref:histone-lysine N-methyltransferase PRDM9-like isoform X1 n=1 Tax=Silurus meridionalis TaxID=175797 RepID=UPI001EEBD358|nr:histone-lysine N-methyltransferase PRDM9-like isoform X1 [Silurus meridionalis]
MRSKKLNKRSSAGNVPQETYPRKSSDTNSSQLCEDLKKGNEGEEKEDRPNTEETLELSSSDYENDLPSTPEVSIHEEEADENDFLFCEDCQSFFFNKCEVHGLAHFIPDTPVPMGVADRARQTLPPGLEIQKSSIPGAGLGVFNKGELVPVGAHFGPYQGLLVNKEDAMKSGYSWVIYTSRQCEKYIDARREIHANWLRYVNCARKNGEQNLEAFQYQGGILYRCCRSINPGQELLLWYDEKYARDLGPTFVYLWRKKCSANGGARIQISCSLCSVSYTTRLYLDNHIKRCHQEEYVRLQESRKLEQASSQETSDPTLSSTKETQQEFQPSSVGGSGSSRPRPYRCSECEKSFLSLGFLKRHQRCHRGGHQCSHCGKIFKQPWHLQEHLHIHTGERPHLCTQCGKSFYTKPLLLQHIRIHTGEKPHLCTQCGKRFANRFSFRIHQLIHTGEKPHRCNQCNKSFAVWQYLRKHQRMHRDERPHVC